MKKVMIGLFALMMVTVLQAASVYWSGQGYINHDTDNGYVDSGAYLILVTDVAHFSVVGGASGLTITGGTIENNTIAYSGNVSGNWTPGAVLLSGNTYNFAILMTSAFGTGNTPPNSGVFGVSGVGSGTYSSDTGLLWAMPDPTGNGIDISLPVEVPEPASMALFGLGAGVLALRRRFMKKA